MAPSARRVLVVYKKTAIQIAARGARRRQLEELMERGDPSVAYVQSAHDEHIDSMTRAKAALRAMGVTAHFRYRCSEKLMKSYDLIITLGGDGTLLWTSHFVGKGVPIVAINSAPASSVGYFAAGDRGRLEETLDLAVRGALKPTRLSRMRVDVDGETISARVLNDILYSHSCPAATTRYEITHQGRTERHRSSGIWIGPAAGSTAAQRSAGGKVLPIASKKIQFVVREPYASPGERVRLGRGLCKAGETLTIRSQMQRGRIFVDGAHRVRRIAFASVVELSRSDQDLTLLGMKRRDA